MSLNIPTGEAREWLAALKPYQRSIIEEFLKSTSPEEAAQRWLSVTSPDNIVPLGGSRNSQPFWDNFRSEFDRFLCDETAYETEKIELGKQGGASREVLIGSVSAAIGASIGYSAILLAPAVALLLCAVGKIGLVAYCKTRSEPKQSQPDDKPTTH